MGLVAPQHMGSSRTRAQTRVPCIGRQILNHCATREVPVDSLKHKNSTLKEIFRPWESEFWSLTIPFISFGAVRSREELWKLFSKTYRYFRTVLMKNSGITGRRDDCVHEPVLFLGFRVIEDGRNLFFILEAASSFSDTRSLIGSCCCLEMCSVTFDALWEK